MQLLLDRSHPSSKRIRSFGPATVFETKESDRPCKLYAFCKKSFPHISKSGLRKCFLAGSIIVNGKPIQCGHVEESRRLQLGDIVKIQIDLDAVDELIVNTTELNVLHIQKGYAILFKACGVSAAYDKDFDKALKTRLWGGQRKTECQLLYHLEKGFSGICVVAETAANLLELRSLCCVNSIAECEDSSHDDDIAEISDSCRDILDDNRCDLVGDESALHHPHHSRRTSSTSQQEPYLELTHRCIICGKIGEVGDMVLLATGHLDYKVIEAKVLQISRCRSKGFISLIDIRVTFDGAPMGVANGKSNCYCGSFMCSCDRKNVDVVVDEDCGSEELDYCDQSGDCVSLEPDSEHLASRTPIHFTVEKIKHPQSAADYRFLHYPTLRLRSIKRALSLCGHQIVGDGGAVKSAKGIFAAIVSVTIYYPDYDVNISSDKNASDRLSTKGSGDVTTSSVPPLRVTVEDPKKFAKLMLKEQEMWEMAEARDRELLRAWSKQCTESRSELETLKEPSIMMDRRAFASSQDELLLPAEEQSDRISTTCFNYDSIDTLSAPLTTIKTKKSYSSLADMRTALVSGMPVEYVIGEAFFCGLRYIVNPAVMVPRKSSEMVIHEALRVIKDDILLKMSTQDGLESKNANGNLGLGLHICSEFASAMQDVEVTKAAEQEVEVTKAAEQKVEVTKAAEQKVEVTKAAEQEVEVTKAAEQEVEVTKAAEQEVEVIKARLALTAAKAKIESAIASFKVLDIGTGSGCLLLSCMKKLIEQCTVHRVDNSTPLMSITHCKDIKIQGLGIDLSLEALQVASENSVALGLGECTDFKVLDFGDLSALVRGPADPQSGSNVYETDVNCQSVNDMSRNQYQIAEDVNRRLDPPVGRCAPADVVLHDQDILPCTTQGPFDVILCNPPYSSRRDTTRLSVACREHEPSLALFAPDGPLSAYRVLASSMTAAEEKRKRHKQSKLDSGAAAENAIWCEEEGLFSRNGHLLLEVGHGQHLPVQKIFSKLPFLSFVRSAKDHKGIDRCLVYQYCGDEGRNHD